MLKISDSYFQDAFLLIKSTLSMYVQYFSIIENIYIIYPAMYNFHNFHKNGSRTISPRTISPRTISPGQYPPGQYPPRTKSPRTISPRSNIPPDNIPPDNIPPDDISSKTCFSKKKKINSSVLNYPKTCVGKTIFFFFFIPVF